MIISLVNHPLNSLTWRFVYFFVYFSIIFLKILIFPNWNIIKIWTINKLHGFFFFPPIFRLFSAEQLSGRNFRVGTFGSELSGRNFRVGTFGSELSGRNFRVGTFGSELSGRNFRVGTFGTELSGRNFRDGTFGTELSCRTFMSNFRDGTFVSNFQVTGRVKAPSWYLNTTQYFFI